MVVRPGSSPGHGGDDPIAPGLQERGNETDHAGGVPRLLLASASVLDVAPLAEATPKGPDPGPVELDGVPAEGALGDSPHPRAALHLMHRLGTVAAAMLKAVPIGRNGPQGEGAGNRGTDEAGEVAEGVEVVRRKKAMAIGLAAVILTSGISWVAASRIRSPAEIAARTAPPAASLISVPVEQRVLSSDVVVRGTVRYGTPLVVTLPLSALKRTSIITTPPVKDAVLNEGSVAMTVSGRPVLVLQGAQPAYRDIGPGATGEDVRQLEEALARLGFDPGGQDGVYDDATGAAVSAWYRSVGWSALGPTEEQLTMARAGQADQFAARAEALSAQEALAAAESDLRIAQERARALSRAPGTLPGVPSAAALDAATRARAEQQRVQAAATLASRTRALEQALQAQRQAQARLDEARTRQPPPTTAEFAGLARAVQDAGKVVEIARDEMATAQEAASAASSADVPGLTPPDTTAVVDAATAAAEVARATKAVE
ncbi:MAG: peptidoglycan-binding domain-containing protein, partial [Actinomycetota bacterium]